MTSICSRKRNQGDAYKTEKKHLRQLSGRKRAKGGGTGSQSEYELMGYLYSLGSVYIRTGRESAMMTNVSNFKQQTQRSGLKEREREE